MESAIRIVIVGNSCSGKTTLGKKLGKELELPVLDLDDISWLPCLPNNKQ